jgi:acetolactate synthase-1/2/3 large subunit
MKDGSVVVSDAWSAFYVTTQAIHLKEHDRYITSGGQAEMWFTMPCCIGACIAHNKWEVLGITWDGSFQFNIQELQTIVHYNLPIKLFVWNNDGYLSIRASQTKFFDKRFIWTDSTCGVSFPSVEKIANAYWIPYFKINNSHDTQSKIDEILSHKWPVLCEVMCIRDQPIIPAVSSFKKEDWTMISKPMEDMYPFLDRKEFLENMIIKPLEE